MNNSNCTNTPYSAITVNRNKLHKVTELKEQDALVLAQFSITPEKELEMLKKTNRKAMQFLSEKDLLGEFRHFINSKTA